MDCMSVAENSSRDNLAPEVRDIGPLQVTIAFGKIGGTG